MAKKLVILRLTFVLNISKNVLHQEFDNALKIFLECFSLVKNTISAPEMAGMIGVLGL